MHMVYRSPGTALIWGIPLEHKVVDDLDEALADGWFDHPHDARDAYEAEQKKTAEALAEVVKADQPMLAAEIKADASDVKRGPGRPKK